MAERALRGARLGGQSFEDERGVEMAPRQDVAYDCKSGHRFTIPFADEAQVPTRWECPRCGAVGHPVDGGQPEAKKEKPVRTHWDMLLERRSIPELEQILSERLELLRGGVIGPARLHRKSGRKQSA